MTLREQIDGARLVMAHNDAGVTLAWQGGHGIHVYRDDGREVDYFMADGSGTDADPSDVRAAMREYIANDANDANDTNNTNNEGTTL